MYVNSKTNDFYIGDSKNSPVKLITELNIGDYETGGGDEPSTNPEWPALEDLTLGNNISWANQQWIVSHVTSTEAYLTLKGLSGRSTWNNLQSSCTTFANKFTEEQKKCLKSVTAGNTSGKVFVATFDQMGGGFSYFNSNSRRALNEDYWTSTEINSYDAWGVNTNSSSGDSILNYGRSDSLGFRPSVCIDLTKYS